MQPEASSPSGRSLRGSGKDGREQRAPARTLFAFDLDGIITSCEMLPRLARLAGLEEEISILTRLTLKGEIPFAASFRKRFFMLRHLPLARVHESLETVPLEPHIAAFIGRYPDNCVVVTGNLDIWIAPLMHRLGCRYFASRGMVTPRGLRLLSVLDKGRAALLLARQGHRVVAVGESVNDLPLFDAAALGVAYAGVHRPDRAIRRMARHEAADGASLCALLETIGGADLKPALPGRGEAKTGAQEPPRQ